MSEDMPCDDVVQTMREVGVVARSVGVRICEVKEEMRAKSGISRVAACEGRQRAGSNSEWWVVVGAVAEAMMVGRQVRNHDRRQEIVTGIAGI